MRVYKVISKYTGKYEMDVFANTMHGAKVWFTKNAKQGLSSSYVFIGREQVVYEGKENITGIKFVPQYNGCYALTINGNLEAVIDLNTYTAVRDNARHGFMYSEIKDILSFCFPFIYVIVQRKDKYQSYMVLNTSADRIEGYIEVYPASKIIEYTKSFSQ